MANGGIIGTVNNPTSTTATGVWQQEEQYEARVTDTWPERALFTTKSLRFNDGSSDNLSRTKGTSSSTTKGTYSFWFKLSKITGLTLIENGTAAADRAIVYIQSDSTLKLFSKIGNSTKLDLGTNRVFRDVSAWYNVVIAIDTTQGTDTNRVKLYVNGVQETSFASSTYPAQNDALRFFTSNEIEEIGIDFENGGLFDGYMAEVIKIDGQQLAPTSFGSTNSDGVWIPAIYTGTFGTNGFNLQFENAAALGTDSSPNGNTFTVNNLTSIDQSTDYPEVNFATLNPLIKPATAIPLSEGNLKGVFPGSWTALPANFGLTKGKWYFEAKNITSGQNAFIGVVSENQAWGDSTPYNETTGVVLYGPGGRKTVDNTDTGGFFATLSSGQIVGVALDLDSSTKTIQFSVNGTDTPNSTPVNLPSTFNDVFIFPYFIGNSSSATSNWELNFGSPAYAISSGNADGNGYGNFEYAPPSGYYSLNTANLAEFG